MTDVRDLVKHLDDVTRKAVNIFVMPCTVSSYQRPRNFQRNLNLTNRNLKLINRNLNLINKVSTIM